MARTIVTVWTKSGSFSFLAADLEQGPVLAPEYGFFVRATGLNQTLAIATSIADAPPPRQLLATKVDAILGVPHVRGWSTGDIPWFGWQSPRQGRVSIKASVAMGDAHGGNGVEWAVVRDSPILRSVLARGDIGPGGSQKIPDNTQAGKRLEAAVESGDMVSLVVGAREGNHF